MCLGENKRFSSFGPGNSDERASAPSSLLTGCHALSICIKAMDDESYLLFVMHSLSVSVHSWIYEINLYLYWFSISSCGSDNCVLPLLGANGIKELFFCTRQLGLQLLSYDEVINDIKLGHRTQLSCPCVCSGSMYYCTSTSPTYSSNFNPGLTEF